MLRFEMDVTAADVVTRTIEGVIVPYGETGRINGVNYRFAAGSIRPRARVPLLLDHDRGRPVGVLAQLTDSPAGALGRFRVDATPAGDEALLQAASGSRGAFSIGAEVVQAAEAAGGIVEVTESVVCEVSLLSMGAFDSAQVLSVAAEADPPPDPLGPPIPPDAEPAPDEDEDEDEDAEPAADPAHGQLALDEDETEDTERKDAMNVEATAPPMILAAHDRQPVNLNAGELVTKMIQAQHGDREALRFLEAALAETISTDVTGLLPPQYERSVMGAKDTPRPLYTTFRGRPLPGVGLLINKPKWTTPPDGTWAATVDADATTSKVVIGADSASIERWDWAGAISWVVVQRSDPSIVDEIYSAAVQDFYGDVEERIAGLLSLTAAGGASTIGGGIADFFSANSRNPEVIVVSPDVWGDLADAGALDNYVAAGGVNVDTDGLTSSYAGLPIVASGALAADSQYLATKRALDVRTTEPVRLTANAIGALNVELAVVGEALFDVDYPSEVLKLAGGVMAASAAAKARAKAKDNS